MRVRRPESVRARLSVLGLAVAIGAALVLPGYRACDAREQDVSAEQRKADFVGKYETVKYLVSVGQLKEAQAQIKKLKRQAKGDTEKALVEEALASYYLARRELSDAEKHASAALDMHPAFVVGFRTRALVRVERGDFSGAEEDLRSALSFDGSDTKSLRGLVEIYLARKRSPEALPLLERYLEVDSLDAWAQDSWARLKAAELGYEAFPLEYLRCLGSPSINRGELAAILVVALETAEKREGSVGPQPAAGSAAEADVPPPAGDGARRGGEYEGRWYAPFVKKSLARGLLRTFPDGTFRPDDPVRKGLLANELYVFLTRSVPAKVEAVLVRPMEVPTPVRRGTDTPRVPGAGYSDVYILSYLWRPVRVTVELGLLEPESDARFGLDSVVGGGEAARTAGNLASLLHSP